MKTKCIVDNCNSRIDVFEKGVSFHCIYRGGEYEHRWIDAIRDLNAQEIPCLSTNMAICSKHFAKRFQKVVGTRIILLRYAVPTIFPDSIIKGIQVDMETDYSNDIVYSPEELEDGNNSIPPEDEMDSEDESLNQPSTSEHSETENVHTQVSTVDNVKNKNIEIVFVDQPSTLNWNGRESENYTDNICRDVLPSTSNNSGPQFNNFRRPLHAIKRQATINTLKIVNRTLINRLKKKTSALKTLQRQVQRKNKQIQSLKAKVLDLKNKVMTFENAVHKIKHKKTSVTGISCVTIV